MYKVSCKNPKNENVVFEITTTKPTQELTNKITLFLDDFDNDVVLDVGKMLLSSINKAMFDNAVDTVVTSDNIFKTLLTQVSFGKYSISKASSATTYTLSNVDVVYKKVDTGKKDKDNNKVFDFRKDFVTYADVVKRYNTLVKKAKKDNRTLAPLNGDLSNQQKRLVAIFIHNIMGKELTDVDKARIEKLGENFKRFADNSNKAKLEQLTFFYNVFNNKTGATVKPISKVIDNIVKEINRFSSKFYIESVENEVTTISIIFNHYINSEVAILEKYKATKLDTVIKLEGDKATTK